MINLNDNNKPIKHHNLNIDVVYNTNEHIYTYIHTFIIILCYLSYNNMIKMFIMYYYVLFACDYHVNALLWSHLCYIYQ